MGSELSPAKVLLLAVSIAAHGNISSLATLVQRHGRVLQPEVLLRILLTYLPETADPGTYVDLLQDISYGKIRSRNDDTVINTAPVRDLDEKEAIRKVRKLRLLKLASPNAPTEDRDDLVSLFIFQRTYRVNSEAALLSQLPSLLSPFLSHSGSIRTWALSTVFPFLRRSCEFYTENTAGYSILEFQQLPDRRAVNYMLSETSLQKTNSTSVDRDLRCLIAPWLYNENRWLKGDGDQDTDDETRPHTQCPGWDEVQKTLVSWAGGSWTAAVAAITEWDGPRDVYFGENATLSLDEDDLRYLDSSFVTTALACVYVIPEATTEALSGAYGVCLKVNELLGAGGEYSSLDSLSGAPQNLPRVNVALALRGTRSATLSRHNLLQPANALTAPTQESTELATALVVSAYIATRLGVPWTVRKAGDLVFLQDPKEQKHELVKTIRAIANQAPRDDDGYWVRCRQILLWLRSWGSGDSTDSKTVAQGPFGMVAQEHIETEIVKAMLSKSRYSLAKAIYEDAADKPLPADILQDAIYQCALNAFDNASNPNRNRGGLRKCDEIIHAFPGTIVKSDPLVRRIEALLKASHGLSDYRLVLKQGEPFSPVVLRVHSDPIDIIGKVLEQNSKAYTRLQEFLEMGVNMVRAGIVQSAGRQTETQLSAGDGPAVFLAEKRIVALCIEAALREDDFETAYSYVVSRLGEPADGERDAQDVSSVVDTWSWKAALKAGQYIRTERSQQPTHLGTASGNLEIRHLEQRIECLATAIRAAPSSELQQILKSFRRCEEQLDSAIREEAANEAHWDNSGAIGDIPGTFEPQLPTETPPSRNMIAGVTARQAEEAPMSLLDLSRATARAAQRNLTALSALQGTTLDTQATNEEENAEPRMRKRDQLRDAAAGTLVSGVGWLIGASVNKGEGERR